VIISGGLGAICSVAERLDGPCWASAWIPERDSTAPSTSCQAAAAQIFHFLPENGREAQKMIAR
jgi:hypothetical protein